MGYVGYYSIAPAGLTRKIHEKTLAPDGVKEGHGSCVTAFRHLGNQPTDHNMKYRLIEHEYGIRREIELLAGDLNGTLGSK